MTSQRCCCMTSITGFICAVLGFLFFSFILAWLGLDPAVQAAAAGRAESLRRRARCEGREDNDSRGAPERYRSFQRQDINNRLGRPSRNGSVYTRPGQSTAHAPTKGSLRVCPLQRPPQQVGARAALFFKTIPGTLQLYNSPPGKHAARVYRALWN